jgi:hypothetical protein
MRRLLLLALLGTALVGAGPVSAAPTPSPAAEPEDPIQVVITDLLPRHPRPGGAVQVLGRLVNTGSREVTDLRVRLHVGDGIITRSELHSADNDRPPTSLRAGVRPAAQTLAPGGTTTFDLRASVSALRLTGIGVYPVDVVARGNAGDGLDRLGLAPTWLPWFGTLNPRPTRVAVVWPLTDVSHVRPDGKLKDDDLATSLAEGGRLESLLTAARGALVPQCGPGAARAFGPPEPAPTRCLPVPVTLAVDPGLLETVSSMTRPYLVDDAAGRGVPAATTWLARLRSSGLTTSLLALPYADPDVTALSRGDDPRNREDLVSAAELGAEVTRTVLGRAPNPLVAWPPPGPVPPGAADALALTGARAFVLDPEAYDDSEPQRGTPSTRSVYTTSSTGANLDGLVVEPDLSALLAGPEPGGTRLAEQRFLAETAIVALEAPSVSRTLLLALPRGSTADPLAATEKLRDLGRVPWLCPVPLLAVATGSERCQGETLPEPREPVSRGDVRTDTAGSLSSTYLRRVTADRDRADQLTESVLSPDPAVRDQVAALKGRLRRAVARAESSTGRTQPDVATQDAKWLRDEVDRLVGAVVVRGGKSLLTSTKGSISVSVENTLPIPVQVRVRFTSRTATLSDAETGLLTIAGGHAVQAKVKAEAQRSGQFVVFAQVVDRAGRAFGEETEVIVRSTRFGRLALAVTVAAFGVLLVAAGFRIVRRARSARASGQ